MCPVKFRFSSVKIVFERSIHDTNDLHYKKLNNLFFYTGSLVRRYHALFKPGFQWKHLLATQTIHVIGTIAIAWIASDLMETRFRRSVRLGR